MRMKSFRRLSIGAVMIYGVGALYVSVAVASSEFSYFSEPELNFWGNKSSTVVDPSPKTNTPAKTESFPWKKYLDPKNDEFFREGDYTPPAPFMEIARNPTDSNIENWFHYLEQKNDLLHRLQERLTSYASTHPQSSSQNMAGLPIQMAGAVSEAPAAIAQAAAKIESTTAPRPDAKLFRLRMYFDSHCPHCEHMLSTTIRELYGMGYWIELRQVDRDESARARIPYPVSQASPDELKRYGIESVPVLLIGDLKAKSFFKVQGDQTAAAILGALTSRK